MRSSGEVVDVLSGTPFVLAMQSGDVLAVNTLPTAAMVGDTTAERASGGSATTPAVATGEYALVTYRFDAGRGVVASRVVLAASPLATGPVHRVRDMVTAAVIGEFTCCASRSTAAAA